MRVLHLAAGSLRGGAARGAYWLHTALLDKNVDSTLIHNHNTSIQHPSIINITKSRRSRIFNSIGYRLNELPKLRYPHRKKIIFSIGSWGANIFQTEAYRKADIIHLHWISGLISIDSIAKINKPIVWTMRDMWPFTGGCHYSLSCTHYVNGCGKCPHLGSNFSDDLSSKIYLKKTHCLPDSIEFVGISDWLSNCARQSSLGRSWNIRTIHNSVDLQEFSAYPQEYSRKSLGLPLDKKIILTGARSINDFYKGFDLFFDSLNYVKAENIIIVSFGELIQSNGHLKAFQFIQLGPQYSSRDLSLCYSSADLFVSPSRQEAFGKTIVESMAWVYPPFVLIQLIGRNY